MVTRRSYHFVERSDAPIERVWDLLADVPGWHRWAGPMIMQSWLEREGSPEPGGVGAIRALGSRQIGSREEIVEYDPPRHMAYTILSGAPVRDYRADVDLSPAGDGTRISWRGSYEPAAGWAAPLVHFVLTRTVHGLAKRAAKAAAR